MSRTASHSLALHPVTKLPPLSRLLVTAGLTLANWEERRRSRQALARLTEQQLQDIGMAPAVAALEIAKPFWVA
ncbi:DUF1127 domain-containing protein [Xinfangfangia sp. CPCC 101601]|uniref:DUF1127 domain-containing protein n=1 Tax=Pseudogemmobacter lacusdianii TaxID=3069608 RepID=A0ABU0VUR3_9RHOB|nr:DUF1127 domain-containing protein [Xinfangfangia sp. CPCC 101601]MDQ2065471.1 DUF1127 domain-containing protein [Xinfangfangia sp. CPCC 101601]